MTTKHGMSGTPTYESWVMMKVRCLRPYYKHYHNYGGRGIKICAQWLTFDGFFADMGVRPAGKTLERKDNNGHYEPSNCVWATSKEQARNRRDNRLVTYDGRTQCVADWCDELGVTHKVVHTRLQRGWPIKRALFHRTWKSKKLEQRNSRRARMITYRRQTRCLIEWCEKLKLNYQAVAQRLSRGWPVEDALAQRYFKPFERVKMRKPC